MKTLALTTFFLFTTLFTIVTPYASANVWCSNQSYRKTLGSDGVRRRMAMRKAGRRAIETCEAESLDRCYTERMPRSRCRGNRCVIRVCARPYADNSFF